MEKAKKNFRGLMHVYHGEGKGKTTAAIGLAVRAAGSGKKVLFTQFLKGRKSGEITVLQGMNGVTVLRNEKDLGFVSQMKEEEKMQVMKMHNDLLQKIWERLEKNTVDLLIMDELTYPYAWNLMERDLVEKIITERGASVELVVTGRNPDAFFLERADYITEMRCQRHPYQKGIGAREGIEY